MLDPDEMAAFEEWKQRKLEGHMDLSVTAFNTEMESLALAWEDGAKVQAAADGGVSPVLFKNPHRAKGMRGYRGTPAPELPAPTEPE